MGMEMEIQPYGCGGEQDADHVPSKRAVGGPDGVNCPRRFGQSCARLTVMGRRPPRIGIVQGGLDCAQTQPAVESVTFMPHLFLSKIKYLSRFERSGTGGWCDICTTPVSK